MHLLLTSLLNYALLGAALFPAYMLLDKHSFTHVLETTGEVVTLLVCWIFLWPAIGFFVLRNHLHAHSARGHGHRKLKLR
jgi:hypothetical protein